MGSPAETTMRAGAPSSWAAIGILVGILVITVSDAYMDRGRLGYRDPEDPRNLFAAMYGGNYKRSDPDMQALSPDMYEYLKGLVHKRGRGLRDPYDPRHLFHSIYGGVFRKR